MQVVSLLELVLASATAAGSVIWLGAIYAALRFDTHTPPRAPGAQERPPVTLLKPVCGLEKHLARNLRTACLQNYPEYQVVYSVQRPDDPALPLLSELQREFGPARVTVVVSEVRLGMNGKINNLAGALPQARYDVLVISDSDVALRPDYLEAIVLPLSDPKVGGVSTFFRGTDAGPWYEQMELLTLNADHFALALFAGLIGVDDFCFGASFAFRRETLLGIGGLSPLANYLVEDNEMGQRILRAGLKLVTVPYVVGTTIDLQSPRHWWQKMTYWDQNTRAARPVMFALTLVLRIVPLSLLLAALRGFDRVGVAVFLGAVVLRLLVAAAITGVTLADAAALRSLWLLPIKDILSLFWFVRAFLKRTVIWRGSELELTRDGRFAPAKTPGEA
jgi:ceramide glucosyltransferase